MNPLSRFILCMLTLCISVAVQAQTHAVVRAGVATPKQKKVLLLEAQGQYPVILMQTTLRVNTDGSPRSYHPQDPLGKTIALNNICNGIAVYQTGNDRNLCFSQFKQAIRVFEQWRDSAYQHEPEGYRIVWKNVFVATDNQGTKQPCVLSSGEYQGYFASMTALTNGLKNDLGECQVHNQIDPLKVPALVLLGGKNVVKQYGAKVGDLLIAYHPRTQRLVPAVIGDTGPQDNLGEGSVNLNMRLLNRSDLPANKSALYGYSIEQDKVLIAILPGSRQYQLQGNRPYSAENIAERVQSWLSEAGYASPEAFITAMQTFQTALN